jgi:hypothetical protein
MVSINIILVIGVFELYVVQCGLGVGTYILIKV